MQSARERLADDLAKIADGDVAAFARVYQATSRKLYGIVVRILGRGDIADEVLQEVYLRVWMRAADYRMDQASPVTWLVAIARNRALDEHRRRRPASLEAVPDLLEWPSEEDIAAGFLEAEELHRLRACLDRLDAGQRRLLELVFFEGVTRDALATLLGQTKGAIRTALRAALANMRRCLEHD